METEAKNKIIEITSDLLSKVGFSGEVKFSEQESDGNKLLAVLAIESEQDLSMLIGKNGQNLSAFEHLVRVISARRFTAQKDQPQLPNFIIDINDYRKSKTDHLIDLAKNVAKRVTQTQRAEALLPMTAYERRLVHTELASCKDIQTESIGQEPYRRIVVKPLFG